MSFAILALIVNLLFVIVLVIGFFIGFWRGIKKSTANLVCSVIAAIVAFFTTTLVTNAILGIGITQSDGSVISLNQVIYNAITSEPTIQDILVKVPNLKLLIAGLPAAFMNVVVFILMQMAVSFVMYIIYKIIAIAFLRTKANPDGSKPKKHRFLGGVIGAVKTLVLMIFVLMPLTSLVGLADTIMQEGNYFISERASALADEGDSSDDDSQNSGGNIISQHVPQIAKDSVHAFNNSAFGFLGGLFGMDDALFDYYSTIEINGEKVKIRSEIQDYWQVYDFGSSVANATNNNKKLTKLNFEKIDRIIDRILDGGLYKSIVADVVYDAIKNFDQENSLLPVESIKGYTDILNAVRLSFTENFDSAGYFKHDIKLVYQAFKTLCQSGVVDEMNEFNKNLKPEDHIFVLDILTKEENFQTLKSIMNNVLELKMIRASIQPVSDKLLNSFGEGFASQEVDTSTWTEAKWSATADNLAGILKTAYTLLDQVDFNTITSNPLSLISKKTVTDKQGKEELVNAYNLDIIFNNLGELIDLIKENPFFGDNVVDKLLSSSSVNFAPPENDEVIYKMDGSLVKTDATKPYTYKQIYGEVILPSMKLMQESNIYEHIEGEINAVTLLEFIADYMIENQGENRDFLVNAIAPLTQVNPTKMLIVGDVLGSVKALDFSELHSFQDWKNDLASLSQVLITLKTTDLGSAGNGIQALLGGTNESLSNLIQNIGAERMKQLVQPLLLAKSTAGKAQEILNMTAQAIQSLLGKTGLSITIPKDITPEQAQEMAEIMGGFVDVYKEYKQKGEGAKLENLNLDNVGNLLDKMQESATKDDSAFKDTFNSMISYVEGKGVVVPKDENGKPNVDNYANLLKAYLK